MLSLNECRKLIPDADHLTDDDVRAIRDAHYGIVELSFDVWALENPVAKNPERVSPSQEKTSSV